jgi:hypothetical protein
MWHTKIVMIVMAGMLWALVPGVRADSLQLKNGNVVQGRYLGGTERAVQFEVNGKIRMYGVGEILSISFTAASADGVIPSETIKEDRGADTVSTGTVAPNSKLRAAPCRLIERDKIRAQKVTWQQGPHNAHPLPVDSSTDSARNCFAGTGNSERKARGAKSSPVWPRAAVLRD